MKFKQIPSDYFLTILDRLTRFSPAHIRFKRVFDDIISKWIKDGNEIPPSKDFAKLGLPSRDVILRYYEDWKEPFYIYKKLYEELSRH